jgi:hypothetical protein
MSRENVEVVQRRLDWRNSGDVEAWLDSWHADAEFISTPIGTFEGRARTYRGHDGLLGVTRDVFSR